jgi:hypothetical protein
METQLTTIESIVEAALAHLDGQLLVDRGRCADVLLDLYGATDDVGLRWSITQRLDDIRHVSLVETAEFRADLEAIATIAAGADFAVPAASATVVVVPAPLDVPLAA